MPLVLWLALGVLACRGLGEEALDQAISRHATVLHSSFFMPYFKILFVQGCMQLPAKSESNFKVRKRKRTSKSECIISATRVHSTSGRDLPCFLTRIHWRNTSAKQSSINGGSGWEHLKIRWLVWEPRCYHTSPHPGSVNIARPSTQ